MGLSDGATDDYVSQGSYASQSSGAVGSMEDQAFISEVMVLNGESSGEGEREKEDKPQKRGSIKKKFADTLKWFSGPPRLGPPAPSPGLPQQQQQPQQGHGRTRSRSPSRPPTPRHTPPPPITTHSSTPSHSQGPYSTSVLYACEAVSPFHLDKDVLYDGIGFHRLEVGMRLGIVQEFGHPRRHPSLPVHIDDGEDCLLLAKDGHGDVGWAFASFLVPVD